MRELSYNNNQMDSKEKENGMKKKVLVIGITMAAAGSEKSFLSFASHAIDYSRYDVDLLLAKKEGDFLERIPKEIHVLEMGEMGEIFLLDRKNAFRMIGKNFLSKNPLRIVSLLPYILRRLTSRKAEQKAFAAHRIWLEMMKTMPRVEKEYDIALAYWGDRTMFYMIDKVQAEKKIAWLHFDYGKPPREDTLYEMYFRACDKVITVSGEIENSLKKALPSVVDKVITVENVIDSEEILRDAEESANFEDDFSGIRILSIGRICEQKGYDLAVPAIARLISEGYPIKWYIIGKGSAEDEAMLAEKIRMCGAENAVSILGIRKNPYPYIKGADIYMQPSRHEGKPIAVEEAKVLCKPILVTDYTSACEQLEGGRLGKIKEISEDGVYWGLKEMLDSPDIGKNFSLRLQEIQRKEEFLHLSDLI
ncbi:MAG: glycosyltransferase [Ruminococcaceae bacterium]|nr:glycosyltransferase [Oscillospiraceae bacterium]